MHYSVFVFPAGVGQVQSVDAVRGRLTSLTQGLSGLRGSVRTYQAEGVLSPQQGHILDQRVASLQKSVTNEILPALGRYEDFEAGTKALVQTMQAKLDIIEKEFNNIRHDLEQSSAESNKPKGEIIITSINYLLISMTLFLFETIALNNLGQ